LQQGIEYGKKEGIKIGVLKGKILTMMEFGLKIEDISKKLNISKEEIEKILKG
jgi:predicted transposase YdaD